MGLECGAPRPQVLKQKVELSKLDHGVSMMPTQIARLLTFWDMASLPVWMSNMLMKYLSSFVSKDAMHSVESTVYLAKYRMQGFHYLWQICMNSEFAFFFI